MVTSVPIHRARCYDAEVDATPLFMTPLFAFAATLIVHVAAITMFPAVKLLDFPSRYGLRRAPLPYPTGVLTAATFLFFFGMVGEASMQKNGLLLSIIALSIVCFFDDRIRLPILVRLSTQVGIAILLFITGTRIYTLTNPLAPLGLGDLLKLDQWTLVIPTLGSLPVLSGLFTIGWMLLTVNALNWFDGIPGQASLLSAIGFLTIGLLSISARVDQPELALIAFILAALAAGAALFELPLPMPSVVPGDSGSMFFGLLLGVLTIYAGGKVATGFLVFGVPLIDSFLVILRRILTGRSPLKGSSTGEHLHHRLLQRGWSPWSIILLTVSLGASFGITALFLSTTGKFVAAILLMSMIVTLSIGPTHYAKFKKGNTHKI